MRRFIILAMAISLCSCAAAPAEMLIWDIWDDMVFNHEDPNSVNPTGPWTWGAAPKLADRNTPNTTGFIKCTDSFIQAGVPWWHFEPVLSNAIIPAIWKNTNPGELYGSLPGKVGMAPGYNALGGHEEQAVVRWTAPQNGKVHLTGSWSANGVAALRDLYIVVNQTDEIQKILDDNGATPHLINETLCIYAGTTIDFAIGVGSDGGTGADTESLDLVIMLDTSFTDPNDCDPSFWEPFIEPDLDPEAASWDFHEDLRFTKGNPTLFWAYGSVDVPLISYDPEDKPARLWDPDVLDTTTLNLFNGFTMDPVNETIPWWHYDPAAAAFVPAIFKNTSGVPLYNCPDGKSALHPEVIADPNLVGSEDVCVARWIAPRAGKYLVQGTFYADGAGLGDYFIIRNGTMQLLQVLNSGSDSPFKLVLNLAEDDTIDFVVGAGLDGAASDTTPLDAAIKENPTCADVGIFQPLDLDHDCYINLNELARLAEDWLKCNDPRNPECTE